MAELAGSAYRASCMSQPKTAELKPKPDSTVERNLSFDITLPRRIPDESTPATLTLMSFFKESAMLSSVRDVMVDNVYFGVGGRSMARDEIYIYSYLSRGR